MAQPQAQIRPAGAHRAHGAAGGRRSADDRPEEDLLAREEAARVRALAAALPEKYRLPLALYYGAEMKVNDIARTLGLPEGTVKRRLHTARAMVEKGLAEDDE